MTPRLLATFVAAGLAALVPVPSAFALPPNAPAAPDLVATADTGPSSIDNITSDSTPTFVVDAGATQFGDVVTVYQADKSDPTARFVAGSGVVGTDGLAVVVATLGDGTYAITATTRNASNEESGHSSAIPMQVDTSAPILLFAPSLVEFIGNNPGYTYTSNPSFDVYAEQGSQVELFEGMTSIGVGVVNLTGAGAAADEWFARVRVETPLADGVHEIVAVATDIAGNLSEPSFATQITIDSQPPDAARPDLLDDDGASATDNVTSNPRPRFSVATDSPGARVVLHEDGLALGSAVVGDDGVATVRVVDTLWLDPGRHCVYAIGIDELGNAGAESPALCLTVAAGVPPFTSNLGVDLDTEYVTFRLRSSVAATAVVKLVDGSATLKRVRTALAARARKVVRISLPAELRGSRSVRVVASVRSADGRRIVLARVARR